MVLINSIALDSDIALANPKSLLVMFSTHSKLALIKELFGFSSRIYW